MVQMHTFEWAQFNNILQEVKIGLEFLEILSFDQIQATDVPF